VIRPARLNVCGSAIARIVTSTSTAPDSVWSSSSRSARASWNRRAASVTSARSAEDLHGFASVMTTALSVYRARP
jgi:hypothetical protein